MAASTGASFILSTLAAILLFSGMQMYRSWFASSQLYTIFGGYLSSVLFLLVLTAVGNLESALFGKNFQTKLFPEVFLCLGIALTAAAMVHRVCTTSGFLFSCLGLYYVNGISQRVHALPAATHAPPAKKKK